MEQYCSNSWPFGSELANYIAIYPDATPLKTSSVEKENDMSFSLHKLTRRTGLALAISAITTISLPTLAAEPLTPAKAEANIAVAKSFYSLINGGDVVSWRQNFAAGWKATPPLPAKPSEVDGYEGVIGAFRAGVPDLKVEQIEIIANDDVVAVRSKVTGTNTAPLFGQPPTNRAITFTAMDIHRITDGKIVETWHVEDFLAMQKQLSGN
jgi:predicted ester cyclase